MATYFEDAAKKLGIKVLGNSAYNTKTGTNYQALFQSIAAKHPDAIMVGGLICENGGQLIKDKVAVLGDNTKVKLLLPDGFTTVRNDHRRRARRPRACTRPWPACPTDQLTGAGATFVSDFQAKYNPDFIDPYTPYAAAAAQVRPERHRGLRRHAGQRREEPVRHDCHRQRARHVLDQRRR